MKIDEVIEKVNQNMNTKKQAIIVAGHSLVLINDHDFLKNKFLTASDDVDVVLACRVSPKQKADIVLMIR